MSENTAKPETKDPVVRLRIRAERKRAEAQREREKIDALYRILPAGQPIIDARDRQRREKLLERNRRNLKQFTTAADLEERAHKLELQRQKKFNAPKVSEIEINGVTIAQDFGANRTRVLFPQKPAENLRLQLKKAGFRWSPSEKAWQRFLSNDALNRAREIAEHFRPAV